jgi:hypothetical protein
MTLAVIPGRAARREPGIHFAARVMERWIPGSRAKARAPE